jgi:UDP-N-acetylglucosamine 2-epimerase (non-hydrolysing)
MKIAIVLGTRPEIIKMSPIIKGLKKKNIEFFIIHTNQHYNYNLDKIFFEKLELPQSKYNLNIGSKTHGKMTGEMIIKIEEILMKEKPDWVLVQGDTNSVLAGAIATAKLQIKLGHIEAGLRSYDRTMPEELNRIVTDHLSDALFCPTKEQMKIAEDEKIEKKRIFVTGNTIVDAIKENLIIANKKEDILKKLSLKPKEYFLLTCHRAENVDDREKLKNIMSGINLLNKEYKLPILFPIHPRTKLRMSEFSLQRPNGLKIIEPTDYLEFIQLEKNAKAILTDSGGIQEEACTLEIPCITLRENTERPETLKNEMNILAGTTSEKILQSVKNMLNKKERIWQNPFGKGDTTDRIIKIIMKSK